MTSSTPGSKRREITVTPRSRYVPEQSDAANERYVFHYTINIKNTGDVTARLSTRHWIICDARNKVQEVRGLGVIGQQPVLKPGDSFEYTSGTIIATPVGTMRGSYTMGTELGEAFEATIPEFSLSVPGAMH